MENIKLFYRTTLLELFLDLRQRDGERKLIHRTNPPLRVITDRTAAMAKTRAKASGSHRRTGRGSRNRRSTVGFRRKKVCLHFVN